jgi:hypothetical protein
MPVLESNQQAKARMQNPLRLVAIPLAIALACSTVGCTLYGEKKPPTLANTTSAEQYERIMWQMVAKQQWNKISPLLSTTLVWNVDGKSLNSGQVVPWLQSLNLKDAVITNASVQPNGPDMTVAYTLQLSGTMKESPSGTVIGYSALSVWQQTKAKGGGWILIAHSQEPTFAASTAPTSR